MTKIIGIILIVLGIVGVAMGGFQYTTRETVVDIGPIHATRDKTHDFPVPPVLGAIAIIAGAGLLIAGRGK
jgi:hypothetical protein